MTLKKANVSAASKKKRSRSNSSASSYSSGSKSNASDNDDDDDASGSSKSGSDASTSMSESESEPNEDEDFRKTVKKPVKPIVGSKRPAREDKAGVSAAKKTKTSQSPPRSKDKKQLIKDQLKKLESALKKKVMSK